MYVKFVLLTLFCGVVRSNSEGAISNATENDDISATCHDKLGYEKCRSYGKSSCVKVYEAWARDNCEEYCGYCTNPHHTPKACVDTQPNCASYPPEICTSADYRIWTEDHCCAFCSGDRVRETGGPTHGPPTHSGMCDNIIDCDTYEDSACVGIYTPWAYEMCPLRCGYCGRPEPCFDKIDYCNQYTSDICTVKSYRIWARKNCRKFCGICYNQTNLFIPGTGTYVEPSMHPGHMTTEAPYTGPTLGPIEGPGKIIASQHTFLVEGPPSALPDRCLYKGNNYELNQKWNDGCDYVCSCFDTKTNRMICTDRCSNWNIYLPIKNCTLVQEPGECCSRLECAAE